MSWGHFNVLMILLFVPPLEHFLFHCLASCLLQLTVCIMYENTVGIFYEITNIHEKRLITIVMAMKIHCSLSNNIILIIQFFPANIFPYNLCPDKNPKFLKYWTLR